MMEGAKEEGRLAAAALSWLLDAGCTSLVDDMPASWLVRPQLSEPTDAPRVTAGVLADPAGFSSARDSVARQPPVRENQDLHQANRFENPPREEWQTPTLPGQPVPSRWAEARTSMAPASVSVSEAAAEAARLAAEADTLEALYAAIEGFEGVPVKATANRTVIFDGNPDSRLMIIGEAPGAEEDRQGKPFVGAAGQLLDRMLAAIGLDRDSIYITNMFFWRPPGNRTPTPQEIALCRPFVQRHVELVKPRAVLALGGTSAKSLFDTETGITRLRGQWKDVVYGSLTVPTLASFHPAYLLRQPAQKRLSWEDLLAFKDRIGSAQ